MAEPLDKAVARHREQLIARADENYRLFCKERLKNWIVAFVISVVILTPTVFFTVPMFVHTWHIITDFWGW